jgi:hypothetical protein
MMRAAIIAIAVAIASWSAFAQGSFNTDGPLMEPERQTIDELRAVRRQYDRPADQRQHEVRIAAAAGAGAVAAIVAIVYWRRRRHATVTNARRTS